MDILDFLSRSEWPLVVGGGLWFLRQPIERLVDRINLTKIDAWGVKAEFEKGLEKVEALNLPQNGLGPSKDEKKSGSAMDVKPPQFQFHESDALMYVGSPSMLVLDSWRRLELTLRRLSNQAVGSFRLEDLAKRFDLDADERISYKTLRDLRNVVAHSNDVQITWDDAVRFQQQTYQLLNRFEQSTSFGNGS